MYIFIWHHKGGLAYAPTLRAGGAKPQGWLRQKSEVVAWMMQGAALSCWPWRSCTVGPEGQTPAAFPSGNRPSPLPPRQRQRLVGALSVPREEVGQGEGLVLPPSLELCPWESWAGKRGLYARHLMFTVPRLGVQGRNLASRKQNRKGPRGPIWQQRNMAAWTQTEKGSSRQGPSGPLRMGEEVRRH